MKLRIKKFLYLIYVLNLGGVGGPYRLDSGNQVFQVSDAMKQNVPENVRRAAKEMGKNNLEF